MNILRSRLIGNRCNKAKEPDFQLFQARVIFNQHRDALVSKVMSDLSTYIQYKFKLQPSRENAQVIITKLMEFQKRDVDMEYYEPILKQLQKKDEVTLNNEFFFFEIDDIIRQHLNTQLNFAV